VPVVVRTLPLVTTNEPEFVVEVYVGNVAQTGEGKIARGPTASIASSNLRRDNLTGGAFFILIK
jgi:hypothetical protein